eukprot:TRINITY_DN10467_c0_g1_i1.p1 TRINITY_DN10467_c0_g1~~TRINITY_DN10467_c0_g1_i1.p1  ORF type:complete len:831 (+),score=100.87 TRINITY_DN10467_c0_g1_i1:12-2504(+)
MTSTPAPFRVRYFSYILIASLFVIFNGVFLISKSLTGNFEEYVTVHSLQITPQDISVILQHSHHVIGNSPFKFLVQSQYYLMAGNEISLEVRMLSSHTNVSISHFFELNKQFDMFEVSIPEEMNSVELSFHLVGNNYRKDLKSFEVKRIQTSSIDEKNYRLSKYMNLLNDTYYIIAKEKVLVIDDTITLDNKTLVITSGSTILFKGSAASIVLKNEGKLFIRGGDDRPVYLIDEDILHNRRNQDNNVESRIIAIDNGLLHVQNCIISSSNKVMLHMTNYSSLFAHKIAYQNSIIIGESNSKISMYHSVFKSSVLKTTDSNLLIKDTSICGTMEQQKKDRNSTCISSTDGETSLLGSTVSYCTNGLVLTKKCDILHKFIIDNSNFVQNVNAIIFDEVSHNKERCQRSSSSAIISSSDDHSQQHLANIKFEANYLNIETNNLIDIPNAISSRFDNLNPSSVKDVSQRTLNDFGTEDKPQFKYVYAYQTIYDFIQNHSYHHFPDAKYTALELNYVNANNHESHSIAGVLCPIHKNSSWISINTQLVDKKPHYKFNCANHIQVENEFSENVLNQLVVTPILFSYVIIHQINLQVWLIKDCSSTLGKLLSTAKVLVFTTYIDITNCIMKASTSVRFKQQVEVTKIGPYTYAVYLKQLVRPCTHHYGAGDEWPVARYEVAYDIEKPFIERTWLNKYAGFPKDGATSELGPPGWTYKFWRTIAITESSWINFQLVLGLGISDSLLRFYFEYYLDMKYFDDCTPWNFCFDAGLLKWCDRDYYLNPEKFASYNSILESANQFSTTPSSEIHDCLSHFFKYSRQQNVTYMLNQLYSVVVP